MFRNRSFRIGPGGGLPPAIKNIMFINGIVFLMQVFNYNLNIFLLKNFALSQHDVIFNFKIYQLVTYMFLHGGFMHVFFNMFILWMFGAELEREWGTKEFLKYYFITGIGAGLINILLSSYPTIGASGAIYGIMVAFALRFPDRMIIFPLPMKIKYYMIFLAVISFLLTFGTYGDGIAHAAHLGGIVIGYVYLKYWYLFYKLKGLFKDLTKKKSTIDSNFKYTKGGDNKTEYYRQVIDELLDKINRVGYLNLTEEEKKTLEEGSKYLREHDNDQYN